MKSQNQSQEEKPDAISWFIAIIVAVAYIPVHYAVKFLWKALVWSAKKLFAKLPIVLLRIRRAFVSAVKPVLKNLPERKVYKTPDIFANEKVAPARQFNLAELNKLK